MMDASKLTDEQLKMAEEAYSNAFDDTPDDLDDIASSRVALRAAAPYLQITWDAPTKEEMESVCRGIGFVAGKGTLYLMSRMIHLRNAALLPKPPDPRREVVLKILQKNPIHLPLREFMVLEILKALDGMKP